MLYDDGFITLDGTGEWSLGAAVAADEAIDVQVSLEGEWHREVDVDITACELPVPRLGQHRRSGKYEGKLCPDCYTPYEVRLAAATTTATNEEQAERTGEHRRSWRDPMPVNDESARARKHTERVRAIMRTPTDIEDE